MKNECLQLYQEMLDETALKNSRQAEFPGWVQHCFRVSVLAGMRLQKLLENQLFTDEEEKRWVLNVLKPQFSGLAEYFTLVYTAELFIPEDPANRLQYWARELGKTWNFLEKQGESFPAFGRGINREALIGKETGDFDVYLAAMIIAREKYLEYILEKLIQLRGCRQNSLFFRA
jgi:hypothetical protein